MITKRWVQFVLFLVMVAFCLFGKSGPTVTPNWRLIALTPLLLFRCFLFNGGFGLLFGYLYRKHGILYAMICHALLHVVSRVIWMIFV